MLPPELSRFVTPSRCNMNKICSKCGDSKPLSEFFALSKSRDGRRPDCKACRGKPARPKPSAESRFWNRVIRDDDDSCWIWTGSTATNNGYGRFPIGRSHVVAHRFSWQIHNGDIPDELNVCHECDNPKCVNPAHLYLGTRKDNMIDMARKGRAGLRKLDQDQVDRIRELLADGKTSREIAAEFDVSRGCIGHIKRKTTWRWLDDRHATARAS